MSLWTTPAAWMCARLRAIAAATSSASATPNRRSPSALACGLLDDHGPAGGDPLRPGDNRAFAGVEPLDRAIAGEVVSHLHTNRLAGEFMQTAAVCLRRTWSAACGFHRGSARLRAIA